MDQLMLAGEGTSMAGRASDPAFPLDTEAMDWIPTGCGVPLHRHSGADGEVTGTVDAARQCEAYLDWCAQRGTQPDQRILGGN